MVEGRTVLLGMTNPLSENPRHALYPAPAGCTGHRILAMLRERLPAVSVGAYLRGFDRTNLVTGEWDDWLAGKVAPWARRALAGRRVLVLGKRVWEALELPRGHPAVLPWRGPDGTEWRLVPHPSGRNLWYNDPANRLVVSMLLEHCYEETGES